VDPLNAVVPEAAVTLTNTNTGEVRTANSDQTGLFRFSDILPGVYTVGVRASGFRTYSKTGIDLSASETRDVGRLALVVGAVTEDVTVTAETAVVQVASSEKSSLVTGTQLEDITLKGRDFLGLMSILPGVVDLSRDSRQATANQNALASLHMSGARATQTNFLIDGVSAIDTGSDTDIHYEPNMDGIAEVRVLASNYQAQFGRMAGGSISSSSTALGIGAIAMRNSMPTTSSATPPAWRGRLTDSTSRVSAWVVQFTSLVSSIPAKRGCSVSSRASIRGKELIMG
jgi:hypothetical protein